MQFCFSRFQDNEERNISIGVQTEQRELDTINSDEGSNKYVSCC